MDKTNYKVLMIAPTPFFADRGCHTQIYEEIKALQKLGHQIILCTYGLGRNIPGIEIIRTWNFPWYKKLSAGPSITKIALLPLLLLTTILTIRRFRPDIVHAHLHEGALIARVCKLFFPKIKYLFDMQGSLTGEIVQHGFVRRHSFLYRLFSYLEKKIAGWFFVITQSDTMILELENCGAKKDRIFNVKDGVDTDIFYPMRPNQTLVDEYGINIKKPRVLFMGLLEEYQGVDVMLQAFSLVYKKHKDIQFIVIGYPNVEKYKKMSKVLGVADAVRFLGRINYQELPQYLSLSDVAIAPKISLTEGDGKIYNYMAMGMVTIAFDRKVSREILGDTGVYAKLADPIDLAKKIEWVLMNQKVIKSLGGASRKRAVKNLSWDAVGNRINVVYNKMVLDEKQ